MQALGVQAFVPRCGSMTPGRPDTTRHSSRPSPRRWRCSTSTGTARSARSPSTTPPGTRTTSSRGRRPPSSRITAVPAWPVPRGAGRSAGQAPWRCRQPSTLSARSPLGAITRNSAARETRCGVPRATTSHTCGDRWSTDPAAGLADDRVRVEGVAGMVRGPAGSPLTLRCSVPTIDYR